MEGRCVTGDVRWAWQEPGACTRTPRETPAGGGPVAGGWRGGWLLLLLLPLLSRLRDAPGMLVRFRRDPVCQSPPPSSACLGVVQPAAFRACSPSALGRSLSNTPSFCGRCEGAKNIQMGREVSFLVHPPAGPGFGVGGCFCLLCLHTPSSLPTHPSRQAFGSLLPRINKNTFVLRFVLF